MCRGSSAWRWRGFGGGIVAAEGDEQVGEEGLVGGHGCGREMKMGGREGHRLSSLLRDVNRVSFYPGATISQDRIA